MEIPFSKYTGCGNDFILIDNRSGFFPPGRSAVTKLCNRQHGVGADGVVLLEESGKADIKMRIFNADGSEAEMCGNGVRCLIGFAHVLGIKKDRYIVETMESILQACFSEWNEVCVEMGSPKAVKWSLPISSNLYNGLGDFLNTGVPHLVLFLSCINNIDLYQLGKELRHHHLFAPHGTNVNIATITNSVVHIRTYERGVENETLACGTGATACGLAAARTHRLKPPVHVKTKSGEILKIGFTKVDNEIEDVTLTGTFTHVFNGIFNFSL